MDLNPYNQICESIIGRIGITEAETGLLAEIARKAAGGYHFETGCLWGATAIAAALANPKLLIITVDIMEGGFWAGKGDPVALKKPTLEIVRENFKIFGVDNRIEAVKANSHPWPFSLDLKSFSFFIDGEHTYNGVLRDWATARYVATDFVLFHDYRTIHGLHPGVEKAVDEVVLKTAGWEVYKTVETLIVLKRIK